MYFILGGILDGKAGFAWCTLQAFYEYLILLKVEEMQQESNDRFCQKNSVTSINVSSFSKQSGLVSSNHSFSDRNSNLEKNFWD
jgi:hypothetical protein